MRAHSFRSHFSVCSIHTAKSWKCIKWEEKEGCFASVISAFVTRAQCKISYTATEQRFI